MEPYLSMLRTAVKVGSFGVPFISSLVIHGLVILVGSFLIQRSDFRRTEFLPIKLIDLPRAEDPLSQKKIEAPPEIKRPPRPPRPKGEKPKPPEPLPAAPTKEKSSQAVETKIAEPAKAEPGPSLASSARVERGGSEAGGENLSGKGDIEVISGPGTVWAGGGTTAAGLGRGSGTPSVPAQPPVRTNREAKPIQTVRAAYPPMALRMGMESDVTLRIEVDPEGNVTKAEIIKSGGAGFDEEALKAVKQSRFEPAQRDGQNVPAEFTYVYRFRLGK
jgi:protein TonB